MMADGFDFEEPAAKRTERSGEEEDADDDDDDDDDDDGQRLAFNAVGNPVCFVGMNFCGADPSLPCVMTVEKENPENFFFFFFCSSFFHPLFFYCRNGKVPTRRTNTFCLSTCVLPTECITVAGGAVIFLREDAKDWKCIIRDTCTENGDAECVQNSLLTSVWHSDVRI